jgi:hypothetical protein
MVRKACRELPGTFPRAVQLIIVRHEDMGAQSYSLRREHNRWIVCAAGRQLMACADKRTALRIIKAAAALGGQAGPIVRRRLITSAGAADASSHPIPNPDDESDRL